MRIAILGATSQIAKDLIASFAIEDNKQLHLFARRTDAVKKWLKNVGLSGCYLVDDFSVFGTQEFDAIINFVGVGNPEQAAAMGASIFDVTFKYDELALSYVRQHPDCRYIFLSSGAAYGASFDAPVDANTKAAISINNLQPPDWYAVAKLHAECRHRSLTNHPIVDIRVFNYFSHTQDLEARFLITDIMRSLRDKTILKTSSDYIVRDYLNSLDFYRLVTAILASPLNNDVVDAYSLLPVTKTELLEALQDIFGLRYRIGNSNSSVNATGVKPCYYSLNRRAADFGYIPTLTSLEGIILETKATLSQWNIPT